MFFGHFRDLDAHDDSTPYSKEEPPSALSGISIGAKRLDFLVLDQSTRPAGIEVKNVREWIYPNRPEIRDLLFKCCTIDAVPVLIARRIPYVTFSVLSRCGCIVHQNYNQLYPNADVALASRARHKDLLGYHDIRVGNDPDSRLLTFIVQNLPTVLPSARPLFDVSKTTLLEYATGRLSFADMQKQLFGKPLEDEL